MKYAVLLVVGVLGLVWLVALVTAWLNAEWLDWTIRRGPNA